MADSIQVVCPRCDAINRVPAARLGEAPRCGSCKAPLFQGKPVALSEARFRRHLHHSGLPLLVDVWASWCGPCQVMAPAFEQAAGRLEPRWRLVKLSTEEAPAIADELGIRSIPTLAVFAAGREVARQAGALSAERIIAWAEANRPAATPP
ncbi:thioredoxin family protein [Roseicella frigidaeris]|uniref:Thiol reductase thioredoxin n=1 Tax=Roseicella frigidaeris TaxID=2230885 RepID=A0A327M985_9PROT|nr:thioredoxin domain-containing protein [Roseicella frigidaeris]RAI58673.1 thiol reductase thioredoxin [Roseicella frigidaeris]